MTAFITDPADVHAQRAWRGFDRITAADEIGYESSTVAAPGWLQSEFRTRCGTGCCYAGHVALDNGGVWVVEITPNGEMVIDGTPVTKHDDQELPWALWEYMLAEPDDPESAIETVRGKRVVHVSTRAERLLGLPLGLAHCFFASGNGRFTLERLITDRFGPRNTVGGTDNEGV
ncbi:hypothetical protein [Nonomuraea wenchangensis]|uniref:Uncharacterized protein n=1 Tax=Nonomuraea wenchangensis TaxID=568860 RepID=A0A1I0LVS5_9ACTN|nr:hypothetical protein [Nonomuraea wenchangensis]SEU46810.1 hypothetical protein SAMN05421811_127148 [Nonomuraea wenchangensis]